MPRKPSMTIIYHAADDTMGDTPTEVCEAYRNWAREQLQAEYPDHRIDVDDLPSMHQVVTDDEDRREEIHDFCACLWDACPWDEIDVI